MTASARGITKATTTDSYATTSTVFVAVLMLVDIEMMVVGGCVVVDRKNVVETSVV